MGCIICVAVCLEMPLLIKNFNKTCADKNCDVVTIVFIAELETIKLLAFAPIKAKVFLPLFKFTEKLLGIK